MATMVPAQKGVEYIVYITLVAQADVNQMQSNPTLAEGDVTVTTDGNAVTNLDTLPDVDPNGSYFVKVTVSATEMNGDNIAILFHDAAGDEWCDLSISIQTSGQSLDTIDINVDDIETMVTAIEGTDLPLVKTDTEAIIAAIADLPEDADITTITDAITALNDPTADTIADAVWDEALTGATHNIATSAGKRLRQAGVDAALIREETCQAGSTASTVKLDAAASATDNFYDHMWIYITDHTGVGQVRTIHDYDGETKIGSVYPDWLTTPDATSDFNIISLGSSHVHELENLALEQINTEVERAVDVTNDKIDSLQDDMDDVHADTALTEKILTGKWEITGNQLIMYDPEDEDTALYTFDLKNAAGAAASTRIFSREPA